MEFVLMFFKTLDTINRIVQLALISPKVWVVYKKMSFILQMMFYFYIQTLIARILVKYKLRSCFKTGQCYFIECK